MKLFKYICGMDERFGVAEDAEKAHARRAEIDPTYHYLPVTIEEVTIPGYRIEVTPELTAFDGKSKEELRAWLDAKSIKYHHQAGVEKLRALCIENQ